MKQIFQTASKLLLFLGVLMIVHTNFTDADLFDEEIIAGHSLSATTLDFSSLDTANQSQKSLFFSVVGLVPTGFQVESVRIRKDGELPFTLAVTTQQTGGSTELCQALEVKVLKDWQEVFSGPLPSLALNEELEASEVFQDLVFVIALNDQNTALSNSSCAFNFTFSTIQADDTHFSDTEIVANTIATGSWTE